MISGTASTGHPLLTRAKQQAGLLTRDQLVDGGFHPNQITRRIKARSWLRVTRGVYNVLPNYKWNDPYDAKRKQAAWVGLLAVPGGVASGLSALALHGVWGLPRDFTPEVAVREGIYPHDRTALRTRYLREFDTVTINGYRVAAPIPALVQALPDLGRNAAVAILDSACNRNHITPDDLHEIRRQLRGQRGARRVYPWLSLVEPNAQSPFETYARLQCRDFGLPAPALQVRIRNEMTGTHAYGDLGWQRVDGVWILVDLDGRSYHETPGSLIADRHRQNGIALTGRFVHLRFAWEDLRTGTIPATITRALGSPSPSAEHHPETRPILSHAEINFPIW